MPQRIIALAGGVVIGVVVALLSTLFTKNRLQNEDHKQRSREDETSRVDTAWEKQKLREEIEALYREEAGKEGGSVSSGYDYRTAYDYLESRDHDLNECDINDTNYGSCEEAANFHEKLYAIDKKLDNDQEHEIKDALEELKDLCFNNPEDVELLYRIGKAHVKLSDDQPEEIIKEHVDKGIGALTAALRVNDQHAEVHKWYAILVGLRAQFQPLLDKAKDGFLVRKHCTLAWELKPDDPVVYHILGRFDFEVAGLGCLEKIMARPIFGESLDSTYQDAFKKFMKAEILSERRHFSIKEKIENKRMIGKTLAAMNNCTEADQWFLDADRLESVLTPSSGDDTIHRYESKSAIDRPNKAPLNETKFVKFGLSTPE